MQKLPFRTGKPIRIAIWLSILLLYPLFSCEKDDICVDGDTPLLVIRFFDSTQPETPKAVSKLRVIGLGNGDPVPTIADRANLDQLLAVIQRGLEAGEAGRRQNRPEAAEGLFASLPGAVPSRSPQLRRSNRS